MGLFAPEMADGMGEDQDASGEMAAMAINASLWGLFNFTSETGSGVTKPGQIGCQYGYVNLRWMPGSPMFSKARASGLRVADWQDVITGAAVDGSAPSLARVLERYPVALLVRPA